MLKSVFEKSKYFRTQHSIAQQPCGSSLKDVERERELRMFTLAKHVYFLRRMYFVFWQWNIYGKAWYWLHVIACVYWKSFSPLPEERAGAMIQAQRGISLRRWRKEEKCWFRIEINIACSFFARFPLNCEYH